MKLIKPLILALSFFSSFSNAASIQDYINNTPGWSSEPKEIVYLTTRCAGILQVTGEHRRVLGDDEFGPLLLEKGQKLAVMSGVLALKEKITPENIKDRTLFWMKRYAEDSKKNTDDFNNIFAGDYGEDFKFCNELADKIIK